MLVLIVVILGIIIAGGFLLYFLGDIVMGMSKKHSKDDEAIRQRQIEQSKKVQDRVDALADPEKAKQDPAIAAVLMNGGKVEAYDPMAEELAAQKVEAQIEAEIAAEEISETEEVEEDDAVVEGAEEEIAETEDAEETEEVEEEEEEEEIDDVADYIAQRRKELMEKLAKIREENDDNSNAMNLDEEAEEDSEEEAEETEEEEEEAEEPTEAEETVEEEKPATIVVEGDLEQLEEKLANLQERLKANEKELRQCKKEFIPLKKVKNTLEKDEKKLRRKEALVAKQKVVLYGVNNYADIDEEKAKKLAEDLDLLDGLKLSVQHCHEVMENNKERYPLLEQVYNLLTARNEDIKAEIQAVQSQIEAIKNN